MTESELLQEIESLVGREHELRERRQRGELSRTEEQAEIQRLEEALDQAWDLLRQRRARAEYGQDPEESATRPVQQVEGYQQ